MGGLCGKRQSIRSSHSHLICQHATVDIASSLPRDAMSESSLAVALWLMRINGVDDVPSVGQVKNTRQELERLYGVRTLEFTGKLGHTYYTNSIADILSQVSQKPSKFAPN